MGNAKEVEDFAERLRALKERSGRSYGSLATRLHVSTSTLHRYCNGDAVPAEYASVERFARLCGATPVELLALHRRWILADASRRRAREADRESATGRPAADGTARETDARPADGAGRETDAQSADGTERKADTRSAEGTGREADRESAVGRPAADGAARREADARPADGESQRSADKREGADDPAGTDDPSETSAASASDASESAASPDARPAAGRRPGLAATSGPDSVTAPPPDEATEVRPEHRAKATEVGAANHAQTTTARPSTSAEAASTNSTTADTTNGGTTADATAATEPDPSPGRPEGATGPDRAVLGRGGAHQDGAGQQPGHAAELTGGGKTPSASAGHAQPPGALTGDAQSAPTGNNRSTPTGDARSAVAGRRRLRAVPGSDGGSAVVSRARRPWALLAGAAAVVVLAVTAVEVRPPGEDGRKDAAASPPSAAPSSTPHAGPTARGHLDRQKTDGDDASGAPRGDGKDGKGERGKEQRANGGASGSPAPGTSKGPDGGGSTQVPLTLSTRSHVWENGCGHRYLIDRPPSEVAPPPTEQDAPTWAAAHGAVHGGTTNVEVTVEGRASSAVVLQALHVRVVGRRTPLTWSSFAMDNGCGGSLTPRAFSVNLDAARPLAHPTEGNDAGKPIPAVSFPYRVSASDPEVLLVNARTAGCDCSWYLELGWTSGGRSGTLRIDDHGSPFRTSSIKGRPQYAYDYTDGSWHTSE
ncbi:transcriptional regulator [Streptomyces violaceusniger]|uniref:transcriptional regulator n=1 Tax=Streptomyces violaceusniger TaxID=68280 RepID=UPI002073095E|nr:transcriptional regulator [Streptomyces violaceusniger]